MAVMNKLLSAPYRSFPGTKANWLNQQFAEIYYRLRLLPWALLLGAVLLVISLLIALVMLVPKTLALKALQHHAAEFRQQIPLADVQLVDHSPQALLNSFYHSLPPESEAPRLVGIVLKAAADQGIAPDKVEYQLSSNTTSPYSRYQLTLPMHAQYVSVRKFANQVLNTLPNAAISEMSFRRDESGDGLVEARLRITLYMSSAKP